MFSILANQSTAFGSLLWEHFSDNTVKCTWAVWPKSVEWLPSAAIFPVCKLMFFHNFGPWLFMKNKIFCFQSVSFSFYLSSSWICWLRVVRQEPNALKLTYQQESICKIKTMFLFNKVTVLIYTGSIRS